MSSPTSITNRAAIAVAEQANTTLGTTMPAAYTQGLEQISDYLAAGSRFLADNGIGAVFDQAAAAIRDGRDPADDAAVVDTIVRNHAAADGLRQRLEAYADGDRLDLIHIHTKAIIAAWSKALEPHAAALARAAGMFTVAELDDAHHLAGKSGDRVQVWADAAAARTAWNKAMTGWGILASKNGASGETPRRVLAMTDISDEQRLAVERTLSANERLDAWHLAHAGHQLRLVDVDTFIARVKARQRAHAEEVERAKRARDRRGFE